LLHDKLSCTYTHPIGLLLAFGECSLFHSARVII